MVLFTFITKFIVIGQNIDILHFCDIKYKYPKVVMVLSGE